MIGYLDCSTGVSGDKLLGALVDAGFDPSVLREALDRMGLGAVAVEFPQRTSGGVSGTGVAVDEPGAPVRHWHDLKTLLECDALPARVRARAHVALETLALAEAEVHGVPVDEVHFHEIGAADTIVDVLGVTLGLDALSIERLVCSPVATGSGTVATAHGELAVPAPATAMLLRDMPVVPGPAAGELTTPTGACLLAAFADAFGQPPEMTLRRVGTGVGTREIGSPNVCRLLLGEEPPLAEGHDGVTVLESNIDHLTPEELGVAANRLLAGGALDVWQAPIMMKKQRTGTLLSVLAADSDATRLAELMMAETGTLGVRMMPAARRLAERDVTEIETSLGRARFKVAVLPGRGRVLRVESDDAARIAAEHGMAVDVASKLLEDDAAASTGIPPLREAISPGRSG